ncbi:PERQ amino acid-rich with GYF domain-containing protein 2-like [Vespula maculifrons]|uniref:PERQ amino acid-rich with GYF domain-containing protein 2-like n=1 Tax=Vespula maculifrons TaxID=7453 RepID=A0ABD2CZY3_VESMC
MELGEDCPGETPEFQCYSEKCRTAPSSTLNDVTGIRDVIQRVRCGDIGNTAEFVFNAMHHVKDGGAALRETFEKNLQYFREIVEDSIDRRIQDEADVMIHSQSDIKERFRTLSETMARRITRIKKRLYEISPDFDWLTDGKDREKLSKLIVTKRQERKEQPDTTDKLVHQVFIRGQWLKKELSRLQEENAKLRIYLEKFRCLAKERKAQELQVPRILQREKRHLDRELNEQRRIYKRNLSIIDDLYIDYQRCANSEDTCAILRGERF